ncbi:hypothetical protein Tco_0865121 [Tanacetum coccineum]
MKSSDLGVGSSNGVNKNKIGFGNFVEFKVDGIPSKLGLYVVDKFDDKKMELNLAEGSLKITKNLISEMLGIRNEGIDIMAEEGKRNEEMVSSWMKQYGKKKDITPGDIKLRIRKSNSADMNFKLNFIVLFTSVMGQIKPKGLPAYYMGVQTQEEVLRSIDDVDTEIERRKWCDMSDIPSFSLGLTQEYADLDQHVVTPIATTQKPNLASKTSNPLPLRPVPLRVCPPGTAVRQLRRGKDKRHVPISESRKSPFIGRVVDADGSLNAEEKMVTKYLFEVLEDHRFQAFMRYVVNAIEIDSKCELLKDIDVIFIPIDNGGQKFLFVVDLKNSRPLLIDHEKNEKIVRKRVKKKIGASGNFIGSEIEVDEFDWKTNNMEIEAGIFVMRHMETCMGTHCCSKRDKSKNNIASSLPDDHMADFHQSRMMQGTSGSFKPGFGVMMIQRKFEIYAEAGVFGNLWVAESEVCIKCDRTGFKKPDNDIVTMNFSEHFHPSCHRWPTIVNKGGLDYLSLDELYNKLSDLEIAERVAQVDKKKSNATMFRLGHLLGNVQEQLDSKARYSAFKLKELDKSEEPKALLSIDSMLNWSNHEGEDEEKGAAQVYGMIAGDE